MDIKPVTPHSVATFTVGSARAGGTAWVQGQTLAAEVVALSGDGRVALKIDNVVIQAQTTVALALGQSLRLTVASTTPQVILQPAAPDGAAALLAQALRQALPRQAPLQDFVAQLVQLLRPAAGRPPALPPPLQPLARELFLSFATAAEVTTPPGLQRALRDSGLFLEAKLARALGDPKGAVPTHDLKAGLLRLLEAAADEPHIARHIEAALARLQVQQGSAVNQIDTDHRVWLFELPVRRDDNAEVLRFHIEREARRPGDNIQRYNITVAFEIGTLGPVQARIMAQEHSIAVNLWAENEATVALFRHHLPELDQQLRQLGLDVAGLACHHGAPMLPEPPLTQHALLDLRA